MILNASVVLLGWDLAISLIWKESQVISVSERKCINANDLELQVAFIPLISCLNP